MGDKFEHTSATTREFTLEFLQQITHDFSEDHIIGSGGYGTVYKGVLENGEEIALKKLHYIPGLDDTQFRNEFNNLMRARHPNITQLVGYCYNIGHQRIMHRGEYVFAHVEERVLCLEYLHGGGLDKHISDESCGLNWQTRFRIIKGVCDGLNYLHNGCKDPIYHLDLKPANILLDKDMVPKIGDFGLSRLFPSTQTYITIKIIGTPGYMPPEYIERCEITSKYDVFSLGVIIVRLIAGHEGYSKCAHMSSQEFLEHVHENWGKRLHATMSIHTSNQVKACIEIALRCVEIDREKRPTIAEIINELEKVDTAESSLTGQVAKNQNRNSERRGRIFFSATGRPPLPFDIFSCPLLPSSTDEELHLTDGVSYNYNGCSIPPVALKTLLRNTELANEHGADVDAGHVSGLIFISERDNGLETLHIALRFNEDNTVKVISLADIFGAANFDGVRLEDSGCIGGGYSVGSRTVDHCLIYVSTKEQVQERGSPWTVVYKTNLTTGKTERLTPKGVFDLSPAVSPSGKTVAVASFQNKRWNGEDENLKTDIYVMNVDNEESLGRKLLVKNGGWPSWASDNIIFFHRGTEKTLATGMVETTWGVFRYNISTEETVRVTPEDLDAMTPAAISETKVAVATIRQKTEFGDMFRVEGQYRHIEIFDVSTPRLPPVQITQKTMPKSHHYNPFVLDGGARIGYHRCRTTDRLKTERVSRNLHKLQSPESDIGLFSVSGVFPNINKDGSKLAFVGRTLKKLWVADSQGVRVVYEISGSNYDSVFSAAWNQNLDKDTVYICVGHPFKAAQLHIYAISNVSGPREGRRVERLTAGESNNAFPSSCPAGNKFVFQSTRGGEAKEYRNLYIMLNTDKGEQGGSQVIRLTKGEWIDTQCQWSPNSDWIAFSSTRDNDKLSFRAGHLASRSLDPGRFSVFLVNSYDPTVVIKVMSGGSDPVFSPDGRSIAMTAVVAAVSVDPRSQPKFVHALRTVRPYGDIFIVDTDDPDDLKGNKDVCAIRRITHSRYECGAPAWTLLTSRTTAGQNALWNMLQAM